MDREGEVEHGTVCRHRLDLTLGREDKYLAGEEIQFDGIQEVHRVGLWVVQDLLDGTEPLVQLSLILCDTIFLSPLLVFPVGSKSLFRYLVHTVRTDLHLNPETLFRHQRHVQGLIAIGLGIVQPVANAVGVIFVYLRQGHVYLPALIHFLLTVLGSEDDTYGQDVIDLVKGHMLLLHLTPDGVGRLHTFLDLILEAHLLEGSLDRLGKLVERLMTQDAGLFQLTFDNGIFLRVLELETQVLQFRLDLIESQTVGQRGIQVERLARNLVLLVGRLGVQRAHVVQTVGYLNQDHTDILAHGEQQLLEVLCLSRGLFAKDASADLCQSVDDLCNLRTEHVLDILNGEVGILHNIVEQGCTDTGRTQSYLRAHNLCHGDGVHDIGLARQSSHALVSLTCEIECFSNQVHLLAMARVQVVIDEFLVRIINQFFIGCFLFL